MRGHLPFHGPLPGHSGPMRGGPRGPQRDNDPRPTTEQTATVQDNGGVEVSITRKLGEQTLTRTVDLSRDDAGAITIAETRGEKSVSQVISAAADGGVDVTLTRGLPSGEELVRTLEIDLGADGELVLTARFTRADGDSFTHEHSVPVEQFLGAADETLSVPEVAEALLEKAGVDVTLVGVADFLAADPVTGS